MTHKIIIIDDDKYNQMGLNYETDILKLIEHKYSHLVRYYKNVEKKDLSEIEKVDIVMIHDSYPDSEIKEGIYKICIENKLHLIKFSNGITATHKTNDNHCANIELKKDRVYTHLAYFLDDYILHGFKPDFEKLINGENYTTIKAILIREFLSKSLLSGYGKSIEYLIPEKSEEEKKLKELYYLAYGNSYDQYFDAFLESSNAGYKELMEECRKLLLKIKTNTND